MLCDITVLTRAFTLRKTNEPFSPHIDFHTEGLIPFSKRAWNKYFPITHKKMNLKNNIWLKIQTNFIFNYLISHTENIMIQKWYIQSKTSRIKNNASYKFSSYFAHTFRSPSSLCITTRLWWWSESEVRFKYTNATQIQCKLMTLCTEEVGASPLTLNPA